MQSKKNIKNNPPVSAGRLSITLPEGWPGIMLPGTTMRWINDGEEEYFMTSGQQLRYTSWRNVVIVSTDPLVTMGIRYLLGPLCPVRLRVCQDTHKIADLRLWQGSYPPDLVIWIQPRYNGIPHLGEQVFRLQKHLPHVRQIVMGDFIPGGLYEDNILINDIMLLDSRLSTAEITACLIDSLQQESARQEVKQLNRLLTHHQWRVLVMLSKGYTVKAIAERLNITAATVFGHRKLAFKRLHISNPAQEAWLLRNVHDLLHVIPALVHIDA